MRTLSTQLTDERRMELLGKGVDVLRFYDDTISGGNRWSSRIFGLSWSTIMMFTAVLSETNLSGLGSTIEEVLFHGLFVLSTIGVAIATTILGKSSHSLIEDWDKEHGGR